MASAGLIVKGYDEAVVDHFATKKLSPQLNDGANLVLQQTLSQEDFRTTF